MAGGNTSRRLPASKEGATRNDWPATFRVSVWLTHGDGREELRQDVHMKEIALHLFDVLSEAWPQGGAKIDGHVGNDKWVPISADDLRKEFH